MKESLIPQQPKANADAIEGEDHAPASANHRTWQLQTNDPGFRVNDVRIGWCNLFP